MFYPFVDVVKRKGVVCQKHNKTQHMWFQYNHACCFSTWLNNVYWGVGSIISVGDSRFHGIL